MQRRLEALSADERWVVSQIIDMPVHVRQLNRHNNTHESRESISRQGCHQPLGNTGEG
jgi:hypothetical protein